MKPMIQGTEAEIINQTGAWNIVELVRKTSPGLTDMALFEATIIAAGIFFGNAVFPGTRTDSTEKTASLFVKGVRIGRLDRMNAEKASCQGAA